MTADKKPKKNSDIHGNSIYKSTTRIRRGKQHSPKHKVVDTSVRTAKKKAELFSYSDTLRKKAVKKTVEKAGDPVINFDSFVFNMTIFG